MASPPGQLSALDWKSIGWQLATVVAGAAITYGIETLVPSLQTNGTISVAVAGAIIAGLHALRKFLTDTRPQ